MLLGEASTRSVSSGETARTTLLSTLRTEKLEVAWVSSKGLILFKTIDRKRLMLWDSTVGGGLISTINLDDRRGAVTLFAVSLKRTYYLALIEGRLNIILRVGKIGRDGLVECRPSIVEGGALYYFG